MLISVLNVLPVWVSCAVCVWRLQCVLLEVAVCIIGGCSVYYWRLQCVLLEVAVCIIGGCSVFEEVWYKP